MWYVFNSNKKPIATCDFEPNYDDLATRGEFAIESDTKMPLELVGLDENNTVIVIQQEPTIEELMDKIRRKRNAKLAESDWTQLVDVQLSADQKMEWQIYRQALRDLPATCDPRNPIWPEKPKQN